MTFANPQTFTWEPKEQLASRVLGKRKNRKSNREILDAVVDEEAEGSFVTSLCHLHMSVMRGDYCCYCRSLLDAAANSTRTSQLHL